MGVNMEAKINKLISKVESFSSKVFKSIDVKTLLVFVVIFALLLIQHNLVGLYFDDYANLSLSYAIVEPDVIGRNYNFAQIFSWSSKMYNTWSGRILYGMSFYLPLAKSGLSNFLFFQSIVITLIFYFIYKIIIEATNKKSYLIPAFLFILYTLLSMIFLRHGIYWTSASIIYVWPLLALFSFIYFYIKICKKIKSKKEINYWLIMPPMSLLVFYSTFSQEQVGIATIAFMISYILLDHLKDYKKYLKIDVVLVLISLISYVFLFKAPGNWVRMDTNTGFAAMNIFEKIIHNYPIILEWIFMNDMQVYAILLTLCMFYMIYSLYIQEKKKFSQNKYKYLLLIIPFLSILAAAVKLIFSIQINNLPFVIFGTLWLMSFCLTFILYFYKKKKLAYTSIIIAAAASIFCLLVSPVVGGRTNLPFIFFVYLIVGIVLVDVFNNKLKYFKLIKIVTIVGCVLLSYKGINNYIHIYQGYLQNKPINDLNHEILENYTDEKTIYLYKVKDSWYGSTTPYEEPSINYWLIEYYNLPTDIEIEWLDIYAKESDILEKTN